MQANKWELYKSTHVLSGNKTTQNTVSGVYGFVILQ
jgi:hypothetical protein